MTATFLWYDLETFGRDPRRSRIAQFAGLRTDEELNPIGDAISLFCQPAEDLLPSPEAALITGITPQRAIAEGVPEAEFFARLHEELSQPGTCAVGYNSIRFDEEFLRYGLYRNFYDPYEREWRNGNCRWDLLDALRLMRALRPQGLEWPLDEQGAPSFKLERLAQANGTRIGDAHEALSDVRALLGLARKFKQAQPRLWQVALQLRDKRHASELLDTIQQIPVLHISGRYPASRHCAALVLPLARHPRIDSRAIVLDLDADPTPLLTLSAEAIADRLYTATADLAEGETRIPLKEVHTNKCPVLVPLQHLRAADFERLGIDRTACLERADRLRAEPGLAEKVRRVFASEKPRASADADAALYEGFASDADKRLLPKIRGAIPDALSRFESAFEDSRYRELVFRYHARNWPETLNDDEHKRWNDYRRRRLTAGCELSEHNLTCYYAKIAELRAVGTDDQSASILNALEAWGNRIEASL